jgi:hypothetical protein
VISLALIGGLAAAKRWGPAYGVVASALLYVAYGLWTPLGLAATAALLTYARGIVADRLTVYALAAAFAKFLLVPYTLGRPIPYYEALWYAAEVNPLWRTYAPLAYLPKEPPPQLALEGTTYAAGASALASRALAEKMGKRAVPWPLLAPEPLWFGHFALSLPLVWTAAYFAMRRKPYAALLAAALAAGFHIYGGVLALIYAALYGAPQLLLAAPLALLTPQSWILGNLLARIPGADPLSKLALLTDRAPIWLAKAGLEAAVLAAATLTAGRAGALAYAGLAAAAITANTPAEFAGFVYKNFLAALPFSGLGKRAYTAAAALATIPYAIQVWYFGLTWDWAVRYWEAFAGGTPIQGPIEESYRALYG